MGETPHGARKVFGLNYQAMSETQILPARETAAAFPKAPPSPSHHILLVDDDTSLRRLGTEVLSRSGYEVEAAEDGAAAWEALNADSFDLMITDNNMPNLTGVELLKKLHATRMALPVIMATGQLPDEEFTQYPWLQPAATLLKPYSIEELLRIVKVVLRATGSARGQFEPRPARPNEVSIRGLE
jgi:two-component system chemotaxis response regulator CheY